MEDKQFRQLIEVGQELIDSKLLNWMSDGILGRDGKDSSWKYSWREDKDKLAARCCRAYNKIKRIVKNKYFSCDDPENIIISRYKRAAIISYVILGIRPFAVNASVRPDDKAFLINEYFAFYLGLHSLLMDFPSEEIEHLIRSGSSIFCFPKSQDGSIYADIVAKEFYFSILYRNYNILSVADKYYLLLKKCSALNHDEENSKESRNSRNITDYDIETSDSVEKEAAQVK